MQLQTMLCYSYLWRHLYDVVLAMKHKLDVTSKSASSNARLSHGYLIQSTIG